MKRQTAIYPLEFKQTSAKLAAESEQSIAKDLGVNETTLYGWVAKYCPNRNKNKTSCNGVSEELKQLKRENIRLKQERDILKKQRRTLPEKCSKVRLD